MVERDLDVVAVVNRRIDVLEALDAPTAKRDLVGELDHSRSTVDRAIRELDSLGLVSRNDGYRRTLAGTLVLESFREFLADLEHVAAAGEVLLALPPTAPMSPAMLRGARVEVAEGPSPTAVLDPVFELFERAERVRTLSVAMTRPDYADRVRELVAAGTLEVEVVYSDELVDFARESRDGFASFVAGNAIEPYVHPDLPYELRIASLPDGHAVAVVAYDDELAPRGFIRNDSAEAYRWATSVFERYREEAEPLAP